LLLGHLVAGQHFGEMSLFDNKPRSAMVKAVGPTDALVIEKDDLFELIDADKEVGIRILKGVAQEMSRRLRDTSTALYVSLCIGETTLDQGDIDKFKTEFDSFKKDEKG
jgi:CRP-like cAMP-binding protein